MGGKGNEKAYKQLRAPTVRHWWAASPGQLIRKSDAWLLILRVSVYGVGVRHLHILGCDQIGEFVYYLSTINGESTNFGVRVLAG